MPGLSKYLQAGFTPEEAKELAAYDAQVDASHITNKDEQDSIARDRVSRRLGKDNRALRVADAQRRWYEANKEKVADAQRRYREANKEKQREYMREYMKKRRKQKAQEQKI